MRRALCVVLCLVASSPFAFAQTLDKAKLRQAIEMPALSTSLGVRFKSRERDGKGNKFEPADKIAELQKKLTGGPDDAFVYLEQHALCLECLKDEKKAREIVLKAEAVLRPHMQTADPKLGYLFTYYGMVLEIFSDNPWSDCEKWARKAVSVAPQDWRTWAYLAHTRHQQIPFILVGGDAKQLSKDRRTQGVLGALHLRRLHPEHVEQAEKVLNEALQYHDKAKQLAPNDAKRQEKRYGFRLTEIILRNGFCAYRGEKPAYPMMQLERTLLDELEAAAKLQPDHLLWQSQLAHQLILLGWQTSKDQDGKPSKTFRPARPEDAQAIREALGHVEMLANQGKGETAVYCYSMLAAICGSMQDNAGAEKHSRKILDLDPKNQQAAEQLQQALLLQGRSADQLRAAQTLAQTNPTSRNCFLLAKAYALNQQYELAQKACLDGIALDKTDVHCLLGVAVLLMRKADDAQSLQMARDQLDRARRECRPDSGDLFIEVEYVAAIHQALSGDPLLARLKLQRMQIDYPDTPRYEKALSAIGR